MKKKDADLNDKLAELSDLFEYGHLQASVDPAGFISRVIREIIELRILVDEGKEGAANV